MGKLRTLPTTKGDTRKRRPPRRRAVYLALGGLWGGAWGGLLFAAPTHLAAQDPLQIVTSLPTYASITSEITGDLAEVRAIGRGDEDPHFVQPRPSFARLIQQADLFVATGLDLELWIPGLLDRANNKNVMEGAPGHVVASSGIELLDVPNAVSRAQGDVHVFGNPHISTDPINGILIARNILAGLRRVDPDNVARYEANEKNFEDRILRRLFGDQLVELLGGETLFTLARGRQFWDFAAKQSYQGKPLTAYVGGWLAAGAPFRRKSMACYHKNWAYFSARFQVKCAIYIEPKPGIPPAPGHVQKVITFMKQGSIPALFAANYFSQSQVERVALRSGATAVVVPELVGGAPEAEDYFSMIDDWVSQLAAAFVSHAADR